MYVVEVWNKYKSNTHYICPTVEDLFELVSLLEKVPYENFPEYHYKVMDLSGNKFLPKEFGWGDFKYWKINSNYREE